MPEVIFRAELTEVLFGALYPSGETWMRLTLCKSKGAKYGVLFAETNPTLDSDPSRTARDTRNSGSFTRKPRLQLLIASLDI
jgi:hypothetical protein